jgi:hypothetical protein
VSPRLLTFQTGRGRTVALALALFALTWPYLMIGVAPDGDAHRFEYDGDSILDGLFPYRDFYLEYPPGSIAVFIIPSLVLRSHWAVAYRFENAIGWALVIVLLSYLTNRAWPLYGAALVPALLGTFTLMRMDAWPLACVLGAFIAATRRRPTLALALLAVGTVIKSWPIVLVPVFCLYQWSRRALLAFVAIVVVTLLPFAIVATVGAYNTFRGQLNRHLQLETIGSSVLLALGRPVRVAFDAGSWSVFGPGADAIAKVQSALQLAGIVFVAWLFARSRRTPRDLLIAVTASTTIFAFAGKILSPQYLLWVAPFALLFPVFVTPFTAACLLTRFIFPARYKALIALHHLPIALLVVRNAVLVLLLALALRLAWSLRSPLSTRDL